MPSALLGPAESSAVPVVVPPLVELALDEAGDDQRSGRKPLTEAAAGKQPTNE